MSFLVKKLLVKCPFWSKYFWSNVLFGQKIFGQMSFLVKKLLVKWLLVKCQFGQMTFWSKNFLVKCPIWSKNFWSNVILVKKFLVKCHSCGQWAGGQVNHKSVIIIPLPWLTSAQINLSLSWYNSGHPITSIVKTKRPSEICPAFPSEFLWEIWYHGGTVGNNQKNLSFNARISQIKYPRRDKWFSTFCKQTNIFIEISTASQLQALTGSTVGAHSTTF